jgi:hypothetical protein
MKTVGNNRGNTTTDPEKYKKHPYVLKGTGIEKTLLSGSERAKH